MPPRTHLHFTCLGVLCLLAVFLVGLARPVTVNDRSLDASPVLHALSAPTPAARSPSVTTPRHARPGPGPSAHVLAAVRAKQEHALQARKRAERYHRWLTQLHHDFWLHGVGSQLYTAWNAPITLKAINWYGFEYAPFVPDGLDRAPLDSILFTIRHLGFNALRLTFADETVQSNPVVVEGLGANPRLRGLHTLDIMQRIIERAHHFGLRVILCNSRSEAGRGPELSTGLWYTDKYSESVWGSDWVQLVTRLRNESAFVGVDLRNEPHMIGSTYDEQSYFKNGPLWGAFHGQYYQDHDWHLAAQTLGNNLLRINPHILIIVEGVQMYLDPVKGVMTGGLWGSNLIGVQYDRIDLIHQSQLVYSVHEYGPQMWQGDWFNPKTTYDSLAQRWNNTWGYLLNANKYLQAPIFVGEFGTCNQYWACISNDDGWKQGFWFKSFVRYLHEHPQVGWAYWALNSSGPFDPSKPNFYSLVSSDWHHYYPLVTTGLAPLLQEPDGTFDTWERGAHPRPFTPEPGCVSGHTCVDASKLQTAASVMATTTATGSASPKLFSVRVMRDVPYVLPADPYRTGDLYLPQHTGSALRPAVVVVHGGSWDNGRKGTPGTVFLAQGLARYGYVTFDINYRPYSHGGQYPNDIQDVEDALGYLASRAGKLRIDLGKLGVVGVSAGGYLALMAGYNPNIAPFAPPHYPNTHVHARAVASFFAPADLTVSAQTAAGLPRLQRLEEYLGATLQRNPTLYKKASPTSYLANAVPTFLWYGAADPLAPIESMFNLYRNLRQSQMPAQLVDLPGSPHALTELSPQQRATVLNQLVRFLNDVLLQQWWQS